MNDIERLRDQVDALKAERDQVDALKAERDQLREYLDASLLREGIGDRLAVALKTDLALATAREAALWERRGHLAHAMWVAYQMGAGLPYNAEPTPAQIKSQDDGWKAFDANPSLTPEMNHENWMRYKLADGWVCGPVKDEAAKTHPDLVPYDDLPEIERRKDDMDVYARQTIAALLADPSPAAERLLRVVAAAKRKKHWDDEWQGCMCWNECRCGYEKDMREWKEALADMEAK